MRFIPARFAVGAALAVWVLLSPTTLVSAAARPARLAFVGTDGDIYECAGDCAKPHCITCSVPSAEASAPITLPAALAATGGNPKAEFDWPTYSPDGRKLAYVSDRMSRGSVSYGVYVYDLYKKSAIRIFESTAERAIYLYWLTDGKKLSFIVTEPNGRLGLMLADAREDPPVRIVTTGVPLFFDWGPHEGELVVHTNPRGTQRAEYVSLLSLTPTSQDVKRVLAEGYSPFKTPCWSRDGKHLAFVATDKDVAHLYVADPEGANPKPMARLMVGESSFVWAPDSRHIAFSTAQLPPYTVMDGISLLDITTGRVKRLTDDEVAAFYFSPDSKLIAYVEAPPKHQWYTWKTVETGSGTKRKLVNFLTVGEEAISWRYFEQFTLSHSIWSPDSSAIVFTGVPVKGEPGKKTLPPGPMEAPPPKVMIMPIDASQPRTVADGVIAFWSPARAK